MQNLFKISLLLLQLFIIAAGEVPQPYCYKNVTETTYKVVTKTRIKNVSSKNFFKKITFKKDTQVEIYEDKEPVYKIKLERNCCEGYKMTELDLCEPQCVENGCPQHSKCVEPEVCECLKGYFSTRSALDAKHYCQPICEKPCPEHSSCVAPNECACQKGFQVTGDLQCKPYCASGCPHDGGCIAPNKCSCQEGYKAEKGSCLPICSLGDQCQNGKCVSKDHCICNQGFSWNTEKFMCEQNNSQSTISYADFTPSTDSSMEVETDIETSNDNIDTNQLFNENIDTTTLYDEYGSSTSSSLGINHKCPDDHVFHKGTCRPLKFVSNEIDCWLNPCQDQHAVCLENGTCACTEGFKLFRAHVVDHNSLNQTAKDVCLSAAEYDARIQQLEQDTPKNAAAEPINWTAIFFAVFGVLIIISALVFLAVKLFLKKSGELDVEGKNLACAYDSRACRDTEKSVI